MLERQHVNTIPAALVTMYGAYRKCATTMTVLILHPGPPALVEEGPLRLHPIPSCYHPMSTSIGFFLVCHTPNSFEIVGAAPLLRAIVPDYCCLSCRRPVERLKVALLLRPSPLSLQNEHNLSFVQL